MLAVIAKGRRFSIREEIDGVLTRRILKEGEEVEISEETFGNLPDIFVPVQTEEQIAVEEPAPKASKTSTKKAAK